MTGTTGEIENLYSYDGFGNILEKKEDITNRILYTGQQYDQEMGQYYLRARYYNPVIGRFTQEDTYRGDGLNLYAYCRNNPVIYYDPSGYAGNPTPPATCGNTGDGENPKDTEVNQVNEGVSDSTNIYRGMTEDAGKPQVGDTARTLGVRPGEDIPVDANGMVYPGTGGMSASPSPDALPTHRKPPEYGGTGKDPVWTINTNDLGPELTYVPDSPGHGTIQPTKPMKLEDYQKALADTNINWEKI